MEECKGCPWEQVSPDGPIWCDPPMGECEHRMQEVRGYFISETLNNPPKPWVNHGK